MVYPKYKNWRHLTKSIGDKCSLQSDLLEYAAQEAVERDSTNS